MSGIQALSRFLLRCIFVDVAADCILVVLRNDNELWCVVVFGVVVN